MSPGTAVRWARALWLLTLAVTGAMVALVVVNGSANQGQIRLSYLAVVVMTLAFASAGGLVVARARGNAIGWILAAMGMSLALGGFSEQYVLHALVAAPGSLPLPGAVAWLGNWAVDMVIVPVPILFLLFPTGRPASRLWAWVLRVAVAAIALTLVATILFPGQEDGITNALKDHGLRLINPTGIQSLRGLTSSLIGLGGMTALLTGALSIVSLVLRYRRAGGEERQQIKWLASVGVGAALLLALLIASSFLRDDSPLQTIAWLALFGFSLLGIPTAITIAILRYRLFDIDVVINKALVYATLSAVFAAVYGGLVLGLGAVLGLGGTPASPIVVASSTLAAAALFRPLRRRVQAAVDHRFYRRKYDAQQTLESFAVTLRHQVDLHQLLDQILGVIDGTLQPSRAWLWLRSEKAP